MIDVTPLALSNGGEVADFIESLTCADSEKVLDVWKVIQSAKAVTKATISTEWPPIAPLAAEFEAPIYPIEAFPSWLGEMISAVATFTQTAEDLAGGLALALIGLCGASKYRVSIKPGYFEPLNLFVVVALASGNRKSSVFSTMTAPLFKWQVEEAKRLGPAILKAKAERDLLEASIASVKKKTANGKEENAAFNGEEYLRLTTDLESLQIPVPPRLFADDTTPEKLAMLMFEQNGRMAVLSSEGHIFAHMAGLYQKGEANIDVFLKGHAGDTLTVDRITRETLQIPRPALTLALTVQPGVIQNLSANATFGERGLLGRILFALPKSLLGKRDCEPPEIPPVVQEAFNRNIGTLLNLPTSLYQDGDFIPRDLALSEKAYQCWLVLLREIEPRFLEGLDLETISSWGGKLAGAVARIAGILHLAAQVGNDAETIPITDQTMKAAIALGFNFLEHAKAAFNLMGENAAIAFARKVLKRIQRSKKFTVRDLCRELHCNADEFIEPLKLLEAHGYCRAALMPTVLGPGRKPAQIWEVNPALAK